MKLPDFFPTAEQLKLVQGVENELLQRKRRGALGALIALAAAIFQIVALAVEKDHLRNIGTFFINLAHGRFDLLLGGPEGLSLQELIGLLVIATGIGTYLVFRWTNFLLQESEEPFRYTFWVKPFLRVEKTPESRFTLEGEDRFQLLDHDLMERLNRRIGRLSLLDVEKLEASEKEALQSHIHISGHYAIREETDGAWVIQVMPRLGIGPASKPATLAYPVNYPLFEGDARPRESGAKSGNKEGSPPPPSAEGDLKKRAQNYFLEADIKKSAQNYFLSADKYNQIVERVYSSIATEVYRQIRRDVSEKIKLFPTNYLRAVALFHEAKDFERSNTVDAYDYAIELYRQSKRYFDIRLAGAVAKLLAKLPVLWRFVVSSQLMEARARTGHCRCLIYRRVIAALSGRYQNCLFEVPEEITEVISRLGTLHNRINPKWRIHKLQSDPTQTGKVAKREVESRYNALMAFLTFPADSPLKRSRPLHERLNESLFDAHAVAALAYSRLDAPNHARVILERAKALAPRLSERHSLWLLGAAELQPDLNQKLLYLQQAAETARDFEIVHYLLAYHSEMRLRLRDEIDQAWVEQVVKDYDDVLRINYGNIRALVAQGYLCWLLGGKENLERARKKFSEGCEIKTINRQTFDGDLNYGLARIAAENGDFNASYNFYRCALLAEPVMGAHSPTSGPRSKHSYYEYITCGMLARYERFKETVAAQIQRQKAAQRSNVLEKTVNGMYSFVLNDCGNAYLNYFHRFGDRAQLNKAIDAYKEAVIRDPDNAVAYYNLQNAYGWRQDPGDPELLTECLLKAEKLAPAWPLVLTSSAQTQLNHIQKSIKKKRKEREANEEKLKQAQNEPSDEAHEMPIAKKAMESIGEVQIPQSVDSGGQPQAKTQTDDPRIKSKELDDAILKLMEEINKLQEDLKEKVFRKTKLASLYEGLALDFKGTGVDQFLSTTIERDKFDDGDVDILRVWADFLSNNAEEKKALEASEKLCRYILRCFYPEDFDANRILHRVCGILEKDDEQSNGYRRQKEICTETLRNILKTWLDQDYVHYASLDWTVEYFDLNDRAQYVERAVKLEPEKDVYHYLLGNVYYDRGQWAEATAAYRRAIDINGGNYQYFNGLGNACFFAKDYGTAINNYQRALGIRPSDPVLHANLAHAYRKLKDWKKAIEEYERARELTAESDGYRGELKLTLNEQGNDLYDHGAYDEAVESYKQAIGADPKDAVLHSNLAAAYWKLKYWTEAASEYAYALRLDQGNEAYRRNLKHMLNEQGNELYGRAQYQDAARSYQRAIGVDPEDAVLHSNLASAYRELKDWEHAAEEYQQAIIIEPFHDGYVNSLGNTYFSQEKYYEAAEYFRKAIGLNPKVAVYHANLAETCRLLNEWEQAVDCYKRALELEPQDAALRTSLAQAEAYLSARTAS
jgi:tetratricopeptide (TPR) repeat protein